MSPSPPAPRAPLHLWALAAAAMLALVPVFIGLAFLLPGAASVVAWDCMSDLACTLALTGRGQMHARPHDHTGAWAAFMGMLFGGAGLLITWGAARAILMFRWLEPPRVAVAALTVLVLTLDVGAVLLIDTLL